MIKMYEKKAFSMKVNVSKRHHKKKEKKLFFATNITYLHRNGTFCDVWSYLWSHVLTRHIDKSELNNFPKKIFSNPMFL